MKYFLRACTIYILVCLIKYKNKYKKNLGNDYSILFFYVRYGYFIMYTYFILYARKKSMLNKGHD